MHMYMCSTIYMCIYVYICMCIHIGVPYWGYEHKQLRPMEGLMQLRVQAGTGILRWRTASSCVSANGQASPWSSQPLPEKVS